MERITNKSFYVLGLCFCLFSIRIKQISLVIFPLIIIAFLSIYYFFKKKKVIFNFLLIYYMLIFISIFSGMEYSKQLFYKNLYSFSTVRILFFLIILSFYKISNLNVKSFISGLKIGIFINYIWGTLEFLLWEFLKIPLNHNIFYEILRMDVGHTWLNIRDGNIRVCGFSWDPLTIGMLSALGFFLYNNKYLKFYSLAILYLSGSRNSILACILTYLFICIYKSLRKNKKLGILLIIGSLLISLTIVTYFSKYKNYESYGNSRRKQYYFSAIESTYINGNPILFLFGGSPIHTGRIFVENKELSQKTYLESNMFNSYWKIESDWAGILAGRGWIGLISYILLFCLSIYMVPDILLKKIIILFFFLGIGYYYETSLLINIILIYVNQNYILRIRRRKI